MSSGTVADFDPEALREKYRIERDRRLRADGSAQYVQTTGQFAHYLDDPYADPNFTRDPIAEDVEVVIIGGGFGGLLTAARLTEAGVDDFRIDREGRRLRRHLVLEPLSGRGLRHRELYLHAAAGGDRLCADAQIRQGAGAVPSTAAASAAITTSTKGPASRPRSREMRWDEAAGRWTVTTDRGDVFTARFVIMAGGTTLGRPKLPGVPGVDDFKGHTFHTSRWDYAYTGGDSSGGLTKLKDKRVGIIGTGATAIQAVPHLGEWAKELFVFQRTPSSVDVRADRPTDPEWAASLKPGWHKERMDNFTAVISGGEFEVDLVNDGWTDLIGNILLAARRRAQAGETGRGSRSAGAARRLPEDGAGARPRRRHRPGPRHRRGAEALVQPVLQAAMLPRRLSADLQPAERPSGRHQGPRRRGDHREGRRGRGRRISNWTA